MMTRRSHVNWVSIAAGLLGLAAFQATGCGSSGDDTQADVPLDGEAGDVPADGDVPTDGRTEDGETGPEWGDGTVDTDEQCDNGNDAAGDGCENDCTYTCEEATDDCPPEDHCEDLTHTCEAGCRADEGCSDPTPLCDVVLHYCVVCLGDTDCDPGMRCLDGACVMGCETAATCPVGNECCAEACTDVDVSPTNCGTCGNVCAAANGIAGCAAGECTVESCDTGWDDCDLLASNGCEIATAVDLANCGSCANVCPARPNADETCDLGVCGFTCLTGFEDCDTLVDTGCEVDTMTNVSNCSSCGNVCAVPANATPGCAGGVCGIGTCNTGFADCNVSAADGCEVNTLTDVLNCSTCGTVCPVPANAVPGCTAGACGFTCNTGFADCNLSAADGCEVDTRTDVANCSACGLSCPTPANATRTCNAGACGFTCNTGFGNCDGSAANGCEINLSTNPSNCGTCGNVCASGTCTAGVCVTGPANDTRAGAIIISLATPSTSLSADTTLAVNNTVGSCGCTSGRDVFYTFTLTAAEIVYADTVGATWDTSLFLQDSTGANIASAGMTGGATCNDDSGMGCSTGFQSMLAARLTAGTYYLVLSGCGSGVATIHFQHLPVGNGPLSQLTYSTTGASLTGTTSGTGTLSGGCCDPGPDNSYWFVTCPTFASQALLMTTCGGAAWDTDLEQRSATRATTTVCNDDSCGLQSRATGTLPAGAGLHTMSIDGCGDQGPYTLGYVFGACTSGNTLCAAGCRNLLTDNANCGSCGNVCTAGRVCSAGACVLPTTYTFTTGTAAFVDACTAPGSVRILAGADDAIGAAQTIPFTFYYYGTAYTAVRPSSNGYVLFGTTAGANDNSYWPTTTIPNAARPAPAAFTYNSDLYQRTTAGVCIATVGTAPNRRFVVETQDAAFCCGDAGAAHFTFEVILNEADNSIDYVYQTVTLGGGGAGYAYLVGTHNAAATLGSVYYWTAAGAPPATITSGTSLHVTPTP